MRGAVPLGSVLVTQRATRSVAVFLGRMGFGFPLGPMPFGFRRNRLESALSWIPRPNHSFDPLSPSGFDRGVTCRSPSLQRRATANRISRVSPWSLATLRWFGPWCNFRLGCNRRYGFVGCSPGCSPSGSLALGFPLWPGPFRGPVCLVAHRGGGQDAQQDENTALSPGVRVPFGVLSSGDR